MNVKHGEWWVGVFIINFLVPRWLSKFNLIISMNSFRWLHHDNYQRRSLAPVR
jgi:hypothetical protein